MTVVSPNNRGHRLGIVSLRVVVNKQTLQPAWMGAGAEPCALDAEHNSFQQRTNHLASSASKKPFKLLNDILGLVSVPFTRIANGNSNMFIITGLRFDGELNE